MRKTNLRKSNGITLIALVITIIVLLILAGVAISMLSGENGILRKAAEAKTKTEEGQKQEETAVASMELETYFLTENKKYKCSNGFITGIKEGTKVSELQSVLPDGYTVKAIDETDNFTAKDPTDGQPIVTTGLAIQKDNKTVARTVIFGDVNGNGDIDTGDTGYLMNRLGGESLITDAQIIASDVNHNNVVNYEDKELILNKLGGTFTINQDVYAPNIKNIKMEKSNEIQEIYANKIKDIFEKDKKYTIKKEYDVENEFEYYAIRGLEADTKVSDLMEMLKDLNIDMYISRAGTKYTGEEKIQDQDTLHIVYTDGRTIEIATIIM